MNEEAPLTISVPEAGKRYFGLSRNAAYDAAARGEIPTIRIGRLLRVPVLVIEQMLTEIGDAKAARVAAGLRIKQLLTGRLVRCTREPAA
jgi:hypothetical protein